MRAEVCRHVGRARALRFEAPACRDQERVVADVAPVHDAQLPQVSRLDHGAHVFHERVAPHVVGDGAYAVACLERLQHARALLDARRERLLADDVRAVLECH